MSALRIEYSKLEQSFNAAESSLDDAKKELLIMKVRHETLDVARAKYEQKAERLSIENMEIAQQKGALEQSLKDLQASLA